jgi:hypothetical protein
MKLAFTVVTVPLLVAALFGCSSSSPEQSADSSVPSGEVAASPESRSELGVFSWSSTGDSVERAITGYDGSHSTVVDFRYRESTTEPTVDVIQYAFRHGDKSGKRTISTTETADGSGGVELLEDSFPSIPTYKRTLELMLKDLRAAPVVSARSPMPSSGSLGASAFAGNITPKDGPALTTGATPDLIKNPCICQHEINRDNLAHAAFSDVCNLRTLGGGSNTVLVENKCSWRDDLSSVLHGGKTPVCEQACVNAQAERDAAREAKDRCVLSYDVGGPENYFPQHDRMEAAKCPYVL